jgi:hypothetical protein
MVLSGGLAGTGGAAGAGVLSRERASAFARAVNLVAADVPGFTGSRPHTAPGESRVRSMLARCEGRPDLRRALVRAGSADFTLTGPDGSEEQRVSSSVLVLPSSRVASRDLAALRSKRAQRCQVRAAKQMFQAMGLHFGRPSLALRPQPAPGAGGSFAESVTGSFAGGGTTIVYYIDTFGFRLGPAEVGLTIVAIGKPDPAADEQRLFALLLDRAKANQL